jgi:hypothetical protein
MRPIPKLEMGNETYWHTEKAYGHSREPRPKSLLKTYMKVE